MNIKLLKYIFNDFNDDKVGSITEIIISKVIVNPSTQNYTYYLVLILNYSALTICSVGTCYYQ